MTRPNTILPELWQTLPEELQPRLLAWITSFEARIATLETQNAELKAQNAELKAQNAELKARLNQNSSNSSRPPSVDPPSFRYKPAPPCRPSSKAPGGQPGHDRNQRVRLQPDQILEVKPLHCRRCGEALQGEDSETLIHQVFEVPKIRPHVVEHPLHRLTCPRCGTTTRGELAPEEQPAHGPRAQAICASLVGAGRMGKRVLTTVESCRSQKRNSLDFLVEAIYSASHSKQSPISYPIQLVNAYVGGAGVFLAQNRFSGSKAKFGLDLY